MSVVAEAIALSRKAGVDPMKVRAALMGGFAQSRVLEVHGERMITGNWKPGFKAKLFKKDLGIAMSTLAENGVPALRARSCSSWLTRKSPPVKAKRITRGSRKRSSRWRISEAPRSKQVDGVTRGTIDRQVGTESLRSRSRTCSRALNTAMRSRHSRDRDDGRSRNDDPASACICKTPSQPARRRQAPECRAATHRASRSPLSPSIGRTPLSRGLRRPLEIRRTESHRRCPRCKSGIDPA